MKKIVSIDKNKTKHTSFLTPKTKISPLVDPHFKGILSALNRYANQDNPRVINYAYGLASSTGDVLDIGTLYSIGYSSKQANDPITFCYTFLTTLSCSTISALEVSTEATEECINKLLEFANQLNTKWNKLGAPLPAIEITRR